MAADCTGVASEPVLTGEPHNLRVEGWPEGLIKGSSLRQLIATKKTEFLAVPLPEIAECYAEVRDALPVGEYLAELEPEVEALLAVEDACLERALRHPAASWDDLLAKAKMVKVMATKSGHPDIVDEMDDLHERLAYTVVRDVLALSRPAVPLVTDDDAELIALGEQAASLAAEEKRRIEIFNQRMRAKNAAVYAEIGAPDYVSSARLSEVHGRLEKEFQVSEGDANWEEVSGQFDAIYDRATELRPTSLEGLRTKVMLAMRWRQPDEDEFGLDDMLGDLQRLCDLTPEELKPTASADDKLVAIEQEIERLIPVANATYAESERLLRNVAPNGFIHRLPGESETAWLARRGQLEKSCGFAAALDNADRISSQIYRLGRAALSLRPRTLRGLRAQALAATWECGPDAHEKGHRTETADFFRGLLGRRKIPAGYKSCSDRAAAERYLAWLDVERLNLAHELGFFTTSADGKSSDIYVPSDPLATKDRDWNAPVSWNARAMLKAAGVTLEQDERPFLVEPGLQEGA